MRAGLSFLQKCKPCKASGRQRIRVCCILKRFFVCCIPKRVLVRCAFERILECSVLRRVFVCYCMLIAFLLHCYRVPSRFLVCRVLTFSCASFCVYAFSGAATGARRPAGRPSKTSDAARRQPKRTYLKQKEQIAAYEAAVARMTEEVAQLQVRHGCTAQLYGAASFEGGEFQVA